MQGTEELVEDLVRALKLRRDIGSSAYPLTLMQLAELTGSSIGRVIGAQVIVQVTSQKHDRNAKARQHGPLMSHGTPALDQHEPGDQQHRRQRVQRSVDMGKQVFGGLHHVVVRKGVEP